MSTNESDNNREAITDAQQKVLSILGAKPPSEIIDEACCLQHLILFASAAATLTRCKLLPEGTDDLTSAAYDYAIDAAEDSDMYDEDISEHLSRGHFPVIMSSLEIISHVLEKLSHQVMRNADSNGKLHD